MVEKFMVNYRTWSQDDYPSFAIHYLSNLCYLGNIFNVPMYK